MGITGFAADALRSLSTAQRSFIESLPKAELHAHLNGSIPIETLQELAKEYTIDSDDGMSSTLPPDIQTGLARLQSGPTLYDINSFFPLFPAIYFLTSTPRTLARATHAVLDSFLGPTPSPSESTGQLPPSSPQCTYLELRTTPRATTALTFASYLDVVLAEIELYPPEKAALIVSIDRRMTVDVVKEIVKLTIDLKEQGRRVVGVDLCGDPLAGNMHEFAPHFKRAKEAGLGITLHIAETVTNPASETLHFLSWSPDRLGHATFLNEDAKAIVMRDNICVEICLTSNLLCKTVSTLEEHHIRHYLRNNHTIAICTDDTLPFRNSLPGEYALLLATPPLGLGLSEAEVERVAKMGMSARFGCGSGPGPSDDAVTVPDT
ncbi:hypothetical protein SERLA73DRAFT_188751 [Serpula lacrymans var. lacrymans S7.3]|uniref:Adenosine deaminase domain-containing protein n=2 Tax=Serpula lacrymans var. lacrymans TaxID=341189 RepID=F8QC44_SERL3|nr:uncharacterized protein SERLADRAFT_358506 [Serpula lacrymans var. lacrymans S7.9]EGN94163.1 hypothetical protein SERLA73DRAFT_188751 [Serpula lacrymans var. lacrymans S7.3]EGO19590.1 hypothetical protein SERLADRAFT_358506 [Serpula lacrymans var. lacrymans S7.9]